MIETFAGRQGGYGGVTMLACSPARLRSLTPGVIKAIPFMNTLRGMLAA